MSLSSQSLALVLTTNKNNQATEHTNNIKITQTKMKKALRETQALRAAYAGGVRPPSLYQI